MQTLDREGFLDIDGMKLEYRMIGPQPGEAPTLVMLHDDSANTAAWESFPDRLAAETGLGVFIYARATPDRRDTEALRRLPLVRRSASAAACCWGTARARRSPLCMGAASRTIACAVSR